jgi:cell division topological specificity factor MinE
MKKKTAPIAKDRLQLLFSQEKLAQTAKKLDLTNLKQELLAVISKYINTNQDEIDAQFELADDGARLVVEIKIAEDN